MLERFRTRVGIAAELLGFPWDARLWWMIPMVAVLLRFGGAIILAQSSAIAPFICTLF